MINLSENLYTNCNELNSDMRFIVTKNNGERIKVSTIIFDENGKIKFIIDEFAYSYSLDECKIEGPSLEIPGLGYVSPGMRLIYNKEPYVLLYGWHTNISNQTIMSWYLLPTESNLPPKTLYKPDLDKINFIKFD